MQIKSSDQVTRLNININSFRFCDIKGAASGSKAPPPAHQRRRQYECTKFKETGYIKYKGRRPHPISLAWKIYASEFRQFAKYIKSADPSDPWILYICQTVFTLQLYFPYYGYYLLTPAFIYQYVQMLRMLQQTTPLV